MEGVGIYEAKDGRPAEVLFLLLYYKGAPLILPSAMVFDPRFPEYVTHPSKNSIFASICTPQPTAW